MTPLERRGFAIGRCLRGRLPRLRGWRPGEQLEASPARGLGNSSSNSNSNRNSDSDSESDSDSNSNNFNSNIALLVVVFSNRKVNHDSTSRHRRRAG